LISDEVALMKNQQEKPQVVEDADQDKAEDKP